MKLAFCMQINLKVSSKLISTLSRQSFAQDDTIIIDRNYEIFSNTFAISLKYLRIEAWDGIHFHFSDFIIQVSTS